MSIFDINFYRKAIELLPVDKRTVKNSNFLWGLLYPIQQDKDKYLVYYRTGTPTPTAFSQGVYPANYLTVYKQVVYIHLIDATQFPSFNSADTYTFGQGMIYNGTAYLCIASSSTGTYQATQANWAVDSPPSANWQVYLPSFIGTDDRVLFNGQYLTLTYALNDYFNVPPTLPCKFRPPNLYGYGPGNTPPGAAYSDIYITSNATEIVGFNVGVTEQVTYSSSQQVTQYLASTCAQQDTGAYIESNTWSPTTSYTASTLTSPTLVAFNGFLYLAIAASVGVEPPFETTYWHCVDCVNYDSPFLNDNNFTIWIPNRIYTVVENIQEDVRNFLQNIVPAGVNYIIKNY